MDTRLAEEILRVRKLFHHTSYDKVMKEAQIRLVQDHQAMFTSECRQMIKERKTAGKGTNCVLEMKEYF